MPGSGLILISVPFPAKGRVCRFDFTFGYAQKAIFLATKALRF